MSVVHLLTNNMELADMLGLSIAQSSTYGVVVYIEQDPVHVSPSPESASPALPVP